jgi:RimJ/RimL family protein N-acetyltransferase
VAEQRPIDFPEEGIRYDGLELRLPRLEDVDAIAPAFQDESIGGAADILPLTPAELRAEVADVPAILADGQAVPVVILLDGEIQGGCALHHLDWELGQAQMAYWLLHHARGKGVATRAARALAEFGFGLGLERIEARVDVGNTASDRVLERAGFTREGVLRSLPRLRGGRVDKTVFSLLPGE